MSNNWKALGKRVLIETCEVEEKMHGPLIIPKHAQVESKIQGRIVGISDDVVNKSLKIGDLVLFARHEWEEVEIDDKVVKIVTEEAVLAVWQGDLPNINITLHSDPNSSKPTNIVDVLNN